MTIEFSNCSRYTKSHYDEPKTGGLLKPMNDETTTDEILQCSDASLILRRTPQSVANYADRGLLPCIKTPRGVRLFKRSDVEAFAEKLLKQKAAVAPIES